MLVGDLLGRHCVKSIRSRNKSAELLDVLPANADVQDGHVDIQDDVLLPEADEAEHPPTKQSSG